MTYKDVVNIIRDAANYVNPTGTFIHGRKSDGSLEYNEETPQIILLEPQPNTVNNNQSYVETVSFPIIFVTQDSKDSTNLEREDLKELMYVLSRQLLSKIDENSLLQNVSYTNGQPEIRQLSGTMTGFSYVLQLTYPLSKCTLDFDQAPTIKLFATQTNVAAGTTVQIGWIANNVNSVTITPFGVLQGQFGFVNTIVNATTTFNGTVTNSAGTATDTITITVDNGCDDATAVLKDEDGNTLSTTPIASGDIEDIEAPNGTVTAANSNNSYIQSQSVLSGGAANLNLPDITVTDSDGSTFTQPSVTDVVCTPSISVWQRPSDWLPMPIVTSAQDTFVGLYAIFPSGNNFAAFRFTTNAGDYQVDWGDGVIDIVASNVVAEHTYDYTTYDPTNTTLTTRGYKQAFITVTPVTGELRTANFQFRRTTIPAQNQNYTTAFIDCILSMPFANTGASIVLGGTTPVVHRYIERFDIKTIGNCTSMSAVFQNLTRLQSVPLFDTSGVTTMANMFRTCLSLKTVPLFDTSSVANMSNMFQDCTSLQTTPLFNTSSVTTMAAMFQGCNSLESVPLFDTSSVIVMAQMFQGCGSLQSVPFFDTSSVNTMTRMFESCGSLESVPLFDTSSVTTMANMFQGCGSLQSVPLFNTSIVTTMATMLRSCGSLQSVPAFNTTSIVTMGDMFQDCTSNDKTDIICRVTVSFLSNQLSQAELVNIFNNLLDRTALPSANINITGNWGATALTVGERAIATGKNWTITG